MRLNAWKYFKKKKTLFNVIIHIKQYKGFLWQKLKARFSLKRYFKRRTLLSNPYLPTPLPMDRRKLRKAFRRFVF
ncbi:hypothetical protein ACM29_04375 [Helicobacter pylori]|nr:hypothetical protein ACM29_04375 [Helicobacter pylori]